MGYTHNWTITLPPEREQEAMQAIEIELRSRFSETMDMDMEMDDDDGALILHSRDGVSEGFSIRSLRLSGYAEWCKTGRGMAELVIAELLWRTSDCVFAHGGEMIITSDWTSAYSSGEIDHDAKTALAVLALRCADLMKGQTLEVKAAPRAWPSVSEYRDFDTEERHMRRDFGAGTHRSIWSSAPDKLVFGIEADGAVNYAERHTPGSLTFDHLVTRHIQAARHQRAGQTVVRGFYYADLAVYLGERQIAGRASSTDPAVRNNTHNLTDQVPSASWLAKEVQERMEHDAQEA